MAVMAASLHDDQVPHGNRPWQPGRVLVRSDRRYRFALPVRRVWDEAVETARYESWWPWLRHLHAPAFETGAVWTCSVKPPLPYSVRLTITLDEVVAMSHVLASVGGDVTGTAAVSFAEVDGGSEVRLVSALAPSSGLLRVLARAARPLVRRGHDWVLDAGARQFREAALPDVDPDPVA